ncbi:MAG: periplasmic binding protein [Myxococcales bacterium]|nr:periplasmic binding protein [Myxococcales bacterium]
MRVITLSPSATEVVAALGATKLLVGVDEYSKYPVEVQALPKVGSFLAPNLEVIVGLHPTVVIVDDVQGQAAGALRDQGIATIECAIHALPDVKTALRKVGERLGKSSEAEAVIQQMDAALDTARAHRLPRHPRVLAIIDREAGGLGGLVAVGPGSYVDELLAVVGADNVLAASGIRYPKISLEEVLRGQPDVILDLSYAGKGGNVEVWKQVDVPAVKQGRVIAMNEPFLVAPSPRVAQALAAISAAVTQK